MRTRDLTAILRFLDIKGCTPKAVEQMMVKIDTNYDGYCSDIEFMRFFTAVRNIEDLEQAMNEDSSRKMWKRSSEQTLPKIVCSLFETINNLKNLKN